MALLEMALFYLEGPTCLCLCTIGLFINAYAIATLLRQRLSAMFHKLMLALVVYDLVYVLLTMLCYSLPKLWPYYQADVVVYAFPYAVPMTQIALAGSCYSTVALTLERYFSVCVPFFKQRHNLKAWMFITPVLVFVTVYGMPRFFEMRVETAVRLKCPDNSKENCWEESYPSMAFNEIRNNPYYISIYANWMNILFNLLVPVAVMTWLNVCIYRAMKQFRPPQNNRPPAAAAAAAAASAPGGGQEQPQTSGIRRVVANEKELKKRDAKYTRASVFMVVVFILCNSPRLVPNCMELILPSPEDFPDWALVLVKVNALLTVANSSFNFLIYMSFCHRSKKKKRAAARRREGTEGMSTMRPLPSSTLVTTAESEDATASRTMTTTTAATATATITATTTTTTTIATPATAATSFRKFDHGRGRNGYRGHFAPPPHQHYQMTTAITEV